MTLQAQVLRLKAQGKTLHAIAAELGETYDAVRWAWRTRDETPARAPGLTTEVPDLASCLPVRPVEIKVNLKRGPEDRALKPSTQTTQTTLHYSDVHFPHQDDRALEILYQITEELQPDAIYCQGDLLDCYSLSRFEKNPYKTVSLQKEIEMGAAHLATMRALAPDAECTFIPGNHEDRLRRVIWDTALSSPGMKEMVTLPGVAEALELPTLLGLPKMGWAYEKKVVLNDRLILKHGDVVRRWAGYSARGEWEKYGKGGMSGHTHRAATFYHRDWNGQHLWAELGCLCRLDPEYAEHPDWQQSFVVITWAGGHFSLERVFIHEGRAVFRGKLYSASSD